MAAWLGRGAGIAEVLRRLASWRKPRNELLHLSIVYVVHPT